MQTEIVDEKREHGTQDIIDEPPAGPQPGDIIEQGSEEVKSDKIPNEESKPVLYEAWTVINNFAGCDSVPIRWYYINCGRRSAQYPNLIADYESIAHSKDEIDYNGQYIDELFSADEIDQLKIYLEKSEHVLLMTKRIDFPVAIIGKNTEFLSIMSGVMNIINLTHEDDYNLPFEVWGQYKTYKCPPTIQLPYQILKKLMQYSDDFFNSMSISIPADDLENVIQTIYDEHGLGANCKFTEIDGTNMWFNKLNCPRQPYVESQFAKLLCRRFSLEMPNNAQDILDRIAEKSGTFIICGNNLSKRIKLKQKFIDDQEKEEEAANREIMDATRGGTIDDDV